MVRRETSERPAALEALGMPDAARARYEAFGLRLAALAVARRPEPDPVDT